MKLFMTMAQQKEIETIADEHFGALSTFAVDMFNAGYKKGYKDTLIGTCIGIALWFAVELVMTETRKTTNRKERET